MALGSLIAGGASLGSALIGGLFGNSAAEAQAEAALQGQRESNELLRQIMRQNRRDLAPFREAGQGAIRTLSGEVDSLTAPFTLENFQADPGFNFRQQQGEQAINRMASARGNLDSGATRKALLEFNGNLADQTFNDAFNRDQITKGNRFNRLLGLATGGQNATQGTAQINSSLGGQQANNIMNANNIAGHARASGFQNFGNLLGGAVNNIGQNALLESLLR